MTFDPKIDPQNDPRQAQDGSKRDLKAFIFYVDFGSRFWTIWGSMLSSFGDPFGPLNRSKIDPKIYQKSSCANMPPRDRSQRPQDRHQRSQNRPQRPQDRPKTVPRGSKILPRSSQDLPSGPKNAPRGPNRAHFLPVIFH